MCGITLIEVLITLLILAIGLLGLGSLQLATMNGQFEAYQRTQALLLAEELASRIRANAPVARDLTVPSYTVAEGEDPVLYGVTLEEDCSLGTIAQRDLCEWNNALIGSSVKSTSNASLASVINARGCVESLTVGGQTAYQVSVAWQGLVETSPPPDALTCGEDTYGDESLRRVVTTTIVLADLQSFGP
jgi:type IV pilus assembly protein PilV